MKSKLTSKLLLTALLSSATLCAFAGTTPVPPMSTDFGIQYLNSFTSGDSISLGSSPTLKVTGDDISSSLINSSLTSLLSNIAATGSTKTVTTALLTSAKFSSSVLSGTLTANYQVSFAKGGTPITISFTTPVSNGKIVTQAGTAPSPNNPIFVVNGKTHSCDVYTITGSSGHQELLTSCIATASSN